MKINRKYISVPITSELCCSYQKTRKMFVTFNCDILKSYFIAYRQHCALNFKRSDL